MTTPTLELRPGPYAAAVAVLDALEAGTLRAAWPDVSENAMFSCGTSTLLRKLPLIQTLNPSS